MRYVENAARVGVGIAVCTYGFPSLLRGEPTAGEGIVLLGVVALGAGIAAHGAFTGVEEATRRARRSSDDAATEDAQLDTGEPVE